MTDRRTITASSAYFSESCLSSFSNIFLHELTEDCTAQGISFALVTTDTIASVFLCAGGALIATANNDILQIFSDNKIVALNPVKIHHFGSGCWRKKNPRLALNQRIRLKFGSSF